MTFFTYFAGLMAIVIIGVGVALMYIDIPETAHLDIRRPNILLRVLSIILIIGGLLSLGGSLYGAVRDWQASKEIARATEAARQAATPPPPAVVVPPSGTPQGAPLPSNPPPPNAQGTP